MQALPITREKNLIQESYDDSDDLISVIRQVINMALLKIRDIFSVIFGMQESRPITLKINKLKDSGIIEARETDELGDKNKNLEGFQLTNDITKWGYLLEKIRGKKNYLTLLYQLKKLAIEKKAPDEILSLIEGEIEIINKKRKDFYLKIAGIMSAPLLAVSVYRVIQSNMINNLFISSPVRKNDRLSLFDISMYAIKIPLVALRIFGKKNSAILASGLCFGVILSDRDLPLYKNRIKQLERTVDTQKKLIEELGGRLSKKNSPLDKKRIMKKQLDYRRAVLLNEAKKVLKAPA